MTKTHTADLRFGATKRQADGTYLATACCKTCGAEWTGVGGKQREARAEVEVFTTAHYLATK